ncbi:serine hydrolase domain-containing protein [Tenggerimyces flavus]|uniref:Serine hydrolase domain-containing protein n=1 Tax=Tenggerimyces flavus TaxID=1708749 RepID=A0ABV7YLR1_9ACTN|nr:serine hydrolase domain-containing protein [Tenggerimyces flavus]MBM7787533.1 CubicO group peptidase (beta-lactamase class C family) [Tenggerimyces flavus]
MVVDLPRSAPEAQGVDSELLLDLVTKLDENEQELHSLMILRHGHVLAEGWWAPYSAERRHELYSLSKSFTSMGVGYLVADGKVSLDDKIVDYFPEHLPEQTSDNLKAMRVRDLLTMTTGHVGEPVMLRGREDSWLKAFFDHPVDKAPGTHFLYNTAATYVCSALVQHITGSTLLDFLTPRLFDKIGATEADWPTSPEGVTLGGFGLSLTTESIAKFGSLLIANDGSVLPQDWVTQATSKQVPNDNQDNPDWKQGYGFQFWMARRGYRGDGAFGQYCIVLPDLDIVIAATSATFDMQAVLNAIWEALPDQLPNEPLPPNEATTGKLRDKLTRLELTPPTGDGQVTQAGTYEFDETLNGLATLTIGDTVGAEVHFKGDRFAVTATPDKWTGDEVVASYAWRDGALVLTVRFLETPYRATYTCRIDGDGDSIHVDYDLNVVIGQLQEHTEQEGRRVKP